MAQEISIKLGSACSEIKIFVEIQYCEKNKHRCPEGSALGVHMLISESRRLAYLRALFFEYDAEILQVASLRDSENLFMNGH